jgi:hypothetical protein
MQMPEIGEFANLNINKTAVNLNFNGGIRFA